MSTYERKVWLLSTIDSIKSRGLSLNEVESRAALSHHYFKRILRLGASPSLSEMSAITEALNF